MRNIILKFRNSERHKVMKWVIIGSLLLILSGCQEPSEKVLHYQENYEIIGTERDEIISNVSDTLYDSIDRSNSGAKEIVIDAIYKHGKKVTPPEGRYQIYGSLTGNVHIRDHQGELVLYELIGPSPYGVESITVDLNGSQTVEVGGFEQVSIMPVATESSHELTAGIWEVGRDIEPGHYKVTGQSLGHLQIFEQGTSPQVYEVIGGDTQSTSTVQLKEGQKLRITGLSSVVFAPHS
jgi:hypothetical protein